MCPEETVRQLKNYIFRRKHEQNGCLIVEEVEFLSQKANDEPKKKAAMEEFDDDEGIPF